MKKIEEFTEEINASLQGTDYSDERSEIKSLIKTLQKKCAQANIPMIVTIYTKKDGYQTKCLLPGEFPDNGGVKDSQDRFPALLCAARGFDKEAYKKVSINN